MTCRRRCGRPAFPMLDTCFRCASVDTLECLAAMVEYDGPRPWLTPPWPRPRRKR